MWKREKTKKVVVIYLYGCVGVLLADACWLFLVVEVTVTPPFLVADGEQQRKLQEKRREGRLSFNHQIVTTGSSLIVVGGQ